MFNFGLLASSTPYIVMALLCAVSYVWMLFDKKPTEQIECISTLPVDHDIELANQKIVTTYIVATDELIPSHSKYKFVSYFDERPPISGVLSIIITELYCKSCRLQPLSDFQYFYFSRPPPTSC
jgi:hypothetical protein